MRLWTIKALTVAPGQPEALEVMVYGCIVGGQVWDSSDVSASDLVRELSAHPAAETINVRINSFGGDAFAGLAIYNALLAHPALKAVTVEGIAGSAASIIAMCGRVKMARGALLMIHNPSAGAGGDGDDLRSAASGLDKLRDSLAGVYSAKSGQPVEKILELMDAETWLSADEAKALGLADEIDEAMIVTPTNRAGTVFFNHVGVPEAILRPVAAGGSKMNEKALVGTLKVLLGMDEGATNEEVLAAFSKLMQGKDPDEAKKPEPEEKPEPPAVPPAPPASADAERLLRALTPEGQTGLLSVDAAVAEVIRLRTDYVPRSAAPSPVSVALAEGRITPAEAPLLRTWETTDRQGLATFLASRPVNSAVPMGQAQAKLNQGPDAVIPERIKQLAKLAGVTPEAIQERMPK